MFLLLPIIVALSGAACAEGWACRDTCGGIRVQYPFGTGPGCGDPRFAPWISCVNAKLMLRTRSGSYQITAIDYNLNTILVSDLRMSTCASMQPSGSFGLDAEAPFKLRNDAFILLGCSSSSPVYSVQNYLCDSTGVRICAELYACPGVSGLGLAQYGSASSSCCVYTPTNLGSSTEINLQKLQCQSYTSVYSFQDNDADPSQWKYGILMQYFFNLGNNKLPSACVDCEQSHGVCGYAGAYNSFSCVCRNGVNTTSNCYGQEGYWNAANNPKSGLLLSWIIGVVAAVCALMIWRSF